VKVTGDYRFRRVAVELDDSEQVEIRTAPRVTMIVTGLVVETTEAPTAPQGSSWTCDDQPYARVTVRAHRKGHHGLKTWNISSSLHTYPDLLALVSKVWELP
jgi:hypothetical protein